MPIAGQTVEAHSGACGSSGGVVASANTNHSGIYTLSVGAGTYCVYPNPAPYTRGGTHQTVTVASGGSVSNVNFGYWTYLGMR